MHHRTCSRDNCQRPFRAKGLCIVCYQNDRLKRIRAEWIAEQGPCSKCGSLEDLEVDHVDPSEKEYPVGVLWSLSADNPKRVNELAKCQILCHDCHLDKTIDQFRVKEHGLTMYNRYGCRCEVCRASKSVANAKRRRAA